jgi:hypothetical protein
MSTGDVLFRLRAREHAARNRGDQGLASDLRLAIAEVERLQREAVFGRRPAASAEATPRGEPTNRTRSVDLAGPFGGRR